MNFEAAPLSGENFDESDTTQVRLPENFLSGRYSTAGPKESTKIRGKIDQTTLTMHIGDIVVKIEGSQYVFSSANGMLLTPGMKIQFYGVALGKLIPGIDMPITAQIRGIVTVMNHSDKSIKPGELLQLKIPDEKTKETVDKRILFHLIPYDETDYIRSITKTDLIGVLKDEQKFQTLFNMQTTLDLKDSIAIKSFRSVLASFIPILSFLDEIGFITFNLENVNITNFIGSINNINIDRISGQQSYNILNGGRLDPHAVGAAIVANSTRSKTNVKEHIRTISQLFNVDSNNNVNNYSTKFLNMLMLRFFSEDKSIAFISNAKDKKLADINDNIQSLRESELSIKSDLLRRKVVAKALKKALPGEQLKISF